MSKRCTREKVKHRKNKISVECINKEKTKNKQHNSNTIYIGSSNVKLWNELKNNCNVNCDVEFTSFLLKLAQKHLDETSKDEKVETCDDRENKSYEITKNEITKSKEDHTKPKPKRKNKGRKSRKVQKKEKSQTKISENIQSENLNSVNINIDNIVNKIEYSLPMVIVEKLDFVNNKNDNLNDENLFSNSNENLGENTNVDEIGLIKKEISNNVINEGTNKIDIQTVENLVINQEEDNALENKPNLKKPKLELLDNDLNIFKSKNKKDLTDKHKLKQNKQEKTKRKVKNNDIRRAPELDIKTEILKEADPNLKIFEPNDPKVQERVSIKIKLCNICNTRHLQDACPFKKPNCIISDTITLQQWNDSNNFDKQPTLNNETNCKNLEIDLNLSMDSTTNEKLDANSKDSFNSYAVKSMPPIFYLEEIDASHGLSIFTKCEIKEFTQFGPLVGTPIKEVDISEDFCMKNLWEIYAEKNIYISTEDVNTSNWLRYIRPAPTRELRNVAVISQNDQLLMITTRNIVCGEELLYWQDDALGTNKKKMEKTNCGGCNISFTHPLYYRMHCFVFHDIRYSLTIRKYHCKICGLPVLGKDNIMKHAVEMHNGQGAYQCQFCKKFFLRLNYLEMHRTYGCAANPHRSRPLCDFCGRKFCQPQKLKVHIKRMHSDITEVLREFQCKSCMKLLGSRAALQRHVKEVHQKQVEGSLTCLRCGKLFQNKSNLKIHMLTHSGVKPFKCREENCNAAFTTKQCLQFHYRKVHGFAEDVMPKIERSVEYTFAAYAGCNGNESSGNIFKEANAKEEHNLENNLMCLDESSDVDDISLDDKNLDDPPPLDSPIPITNETSNSNQTPPILEAYNSQKINNSSKVVSKGSKKWLGEEINLQISEINNQNKSQQENNENIILDVEEGQNFDKNRLNLNLNMYSRHESSNASLLVEAALDSVSDIQIATNETNLDNNSQNVAESLVSNLYSLSHQDNLPDVSYNNNEEDLNESRDINLISPTVNDHISVTDHDLNENRTISLDYSSLHQNEFTPPNSPRNQLIHDYNLQNSPSNTPRSRLEYLESNNSSPRYDFNNQAAPNENLSSDESNNDIVAQNLSLNNQKDKLRLDLTYKTHYENLVESELRGKYDMRKYDFENSSDLAQRNKIYDIALDERTKNYNEINLTNSDIRNNKFDIDITSSEHELKIKQFDLIESDFRANLLRSKELEIDELRKNFDDERNKILYDTNLESEIRKNYENLTENLELRGKTYELPSSLEGRKSFDLSENLELRAKNYLESNLEGRKPNFDLSESLELRTKSYDVSENLEIRVKNYDLSGNLDGRKPNFDLSENLELRSKNYLEGNLEVRKQSFELSENLELRSKNYDVPDNLEGRKSYDLSENFNLKSKNYELIESLEVRSKNYESNLELDFNNRDSRNFEPLVLNSELQGLDMSARSYNFHSSNFNRYHHIYGELERSTVDLRLGYSPPPPPYSHADVLRVVSLDLTPPGRHSVDLSLRSHSLHSQLQNSRLLENRLISTEHSLSTNRILSEHNRLALDQTRLLSTEHNLSTNRLLGAERIIPDTPNRLLSDHTTNRILSSDSTNRLLTEQSRSVITEDNRGILTEPSRLLDQRTLLTDNRILNTNTPSLDLVARGGLSPGYTGYSVSPSSYHATSLARSHGNSPGHTASASYHHYSTYY